MLAFTEFRRIRKTYIDDETRAQCRLIWNKYIQMKKNFLKMKTPPTPIAVTNTIPSGWTICEGQTYSLGTCEAAPPTPKEHYVPGCWTVNKEEGINPMNYATATVQAGTTETQDQRKYLSQRLENIYYKLEEPLFAAFGLSDDQVPLSPKELKERLASGKFIIKGVKDESEDDEFEDDAYFYGSWVNMIRWRDPAKKADHDGYNAARKELREKYQAALDIIKIDEPKAGLDAIKALEEWKPTGAAN